MYSVYDSKCNEMVFPQGISDKNPTFSWKLQSDKNSTFQVGYRIYVWNRDVLVWDSGYQESGEVFGVVYNGEALRTGEYYSWQIESTNNHGEVGVGEKATFLMGIVEDDFWKAKWIGATVERKPLTDTTESWKIFAGLLKGHTHPEQILDAPVYMRRNVTIEKPVKKARIYATARGVYTLSLDDKEVSNLFAPEYTSYQKHLSYQTYDVTNYLQEGEHGIGCILADGWYSGKIGLMGVGNQYGNQNAFLMQLVIDYMDGTTEYVVTDESFKWAHGAYLYGDLFVGEYYDATKAYSGFSQGDFIADAWNDVKVEEVDTTCLMGQSIEPIEIIRTLKPTVIKSPKGEWILDAGENITGYTGFCLQGIKGVTISLEHSEVLDKEGNFLQNIMGQNKNQKDYYTGANDGENEYIPKFTFHGFRYVKVEGLEQVDAAAFTIYVIGSRLQKTGSFITSNRLLNRLQENIVRSQEGNMLAIPTDCPQRERAGWTGDMQVYVPTATFNMDVHAFLKRWLYDMRLEQTTDGQIPHVIPAIDSNKYINAGMGGGISSAGWGDACVIVPYRLYQAYGDKKVLKENFQMMCRWMDYVTTQVGESGLWDNGFHFGDWLIPSIMKETHDPLETAKRTKEEVATMMYAYSTGLMIEICNLLGETQKADYFIEKNMQTRRAFSATYVSDEGSMRQQLQGLYVLALQMHLVEESKKEGCIAQLVRLIEANNYCLDTGFLSVPFLLDVLCTHGHQEVAYKVLFNESAPSWLYALKHGATTIWENWTAIMPDGTRTNSSYNHFAFGCVGDFLYRRIGGLTVEEAGYKKVRIEPDFLCGLDWAKTTYNSRYGEIMISWTKEENHHCIQVELPPNVTGVVVIGEEMIEVGNGHFVFEQPIA